MGPVVIGASVPGNDVRQRRALQEIPVVEEKHVVDIDPQVLEQRGHLRQPHIVGGAIAVVVIGHDMDMQVRGREEPQAGCAREIVLANYGFVQHVTARVAGRLPLSTLA